jgi:hypothetical protein
MGVKGDGGGRATPFLEVGDVEKKGPRRGGGPAGDRRAARPKPSRGGHGLATTSSRGRWPLGQGREAADMWAPRPHCRAVKSSQNDSKYFKRFQKTYKLHLIQKGPFRSWKILNKI